MPSGVAFSRLRCGNCADNAVKEIPSSVELTLTLSKFQTYTLIKMYVEYLIQTWIVFLVSYAFVAAILFALYCVKDLIVFVTELLRQPYPPGQDESGSRAETPDQPSLSQRFDQPSFASEAPLPAKSEMHKVMTAWPRPAAQQQSTLRRVAALDNAEPIFTSDKPKAQTDLTEWNAKKAKVAAKRQTAGDCTSSSESIYICATALSSMFCSANCRRSPCPAV